MALYYKMRQILLQNATKVYYKIRQVFYYKMRQFYYRMRRLLQIATVQLFIDELIFSYKFMLLTLRVFSVNSFKYVILCAIWYHLYNLKNMKSTHGGVILLLELQALHGCFSRLLNCTNGT